MQFSAFLFNPIIRVYTLRALLLVALAVIALEWGTLVNFGQKWRIAVQWTLPSMGLGCLIVVHHISALFATQKLIAVVDLFLNISEIICAIVLIVLNETSDILKILYVIGLQDVSLLNPILISLLNPILNRILKSLILILLTATATFRIATFRASPDRFWRQKFGFLGCCPPANPPYTPSRILLNRSLARPLVRGEFWGIILLRALILSGIVLGFPVFAVYSIIYSPLRTHIRSDTFTDRLGHPWEIVYPTEGAITVIYNPFPSENNFIANVTASGWDNIAVACPSVLTSRSDTRDLPSCWDFGCFYQVAKCPVSWDQTTNITVSLSFSPQNALFPIYILPGQGDINDVFTFTDRIPVLRGSRLFVCMTWTSRRIISKPSSLLSAPFDVTYLIQISWCLKLMYHQPWRTVQHMEVNTLLNINHLEASEPFSSTVTLVPRENYPTKWVQESTATPLDGISKVGGLWTFVEGVFVLLFGANVIYFAFGRRPLTALGIVHLFQRRGLIKQWHEDFPALHDEGGRPGDASAGIVAFIRERLVDLDPVEGQDGKDATTDDLEAQNGEQNSENQADCAPQSPRSMEGDVLLNPVHNESSTPFSGLNPSRKYLIQAGYRLDDVPLTD
ncbi:hypothetical protein B0H16DRAFT_1647425 [Mycena metata]|uniref:Uncharacterized protein n=1 Tax=Mycena metata TaxID=1033252 RepID=A0AAD7DPG6_9AGAR|nr:hypothetical protein B0H16DRAFT_1647425 [Mycena metata]